MPVYFSPQAEHDLEEIGDFIALDNPIRARSFIREIRDHCSRMSASPLAYPARAELGSDIRACTHGYYVIFFKPVDDGVLVARILHGARHLAALFPGTASEP